MSNQDDLLIKNFEVVFASTLRSTASGSSFQGKFEKGKATFVANQTYWDREAVIIPVRDLKILLKEANQTSLLSELNKAQDTAGRLMEEKSKERLEKMAESLSKKYGKQR